MLTANAKLQKKMSYNLISLDNFTLKNRSKLILENISLEIQKGKIIGVIGPSGSGKTTLLKLLVDLLFPEKGWTYSGSIIQLPGLRCACILQNPSLQIFQNFVFEEFAWSKKEAEQVLTKMGLLHLLDKRCLELSQGEKTIVAILRALSHKVSLIILDEVMVNLSAAKRDWLINVLQSFIKDGGTVITVEHSPQILNLADNFILLKKGKAKTINKRAAKKYFTDTFICANHTKPKKNTRAKTKLSLAKIVDPQIAASISHPVKLKICVGEIVGLHGDTGSGKSTLIDIICGIRKPKMGLISFEGKQLKKLKDRKNIIALSTQESMQQFYSNSIATELELAGLDYNAPTTKNIIKLFQLEELLQHDLNNLSYGEKQRLAIVLTILSKAPIIIFDEPTYGMDAATFQAFLQALNLQTTTDRITIIATHEPALLKLTDKTINL